MGIFNIEWEIKVTMIENCFSCLDLKEIDNRDYRYFCDKFKKGIYAPRESGCEGMRVFDRRKGDRRNVKEKIYPPKPSLPYED